MLELFSFDFMQNALFASVLVSVICGVIGTLIVINRMVFIAGGIAHGSYGGIGLALYFGIAPMLGASLFALFLGLIIAYITHQNATRLDSLIGVIWAFGMALGIIMTDLTPGYNVDLMSYLFGAILSVSTQDLYGMSGVLVLVLSFVLLFYKQLLAMSFDAQFAKLRGVNVTALYIALVLMTALGVVIIIRAVGLILVIALLTIPPYIAEKLTNSMGSMMFMSVLLSTFFCITGLIVSSVFNLSAGACIISVGTLSFFLQFLYLKMKTC
ncbi:metal ABC transporter permease [Sulfurospirillum barnesii]|uniref:ABC-type Mn2+/Zn2+ transport system, permease component n=1 Tax=Sulfurospirillum barnesii (strain ATCC 700032 / DSM 10660 / SES-3) TaxID=760154 RepID=I3XU50_SULBS|nr:metal ABC transporter permease [Sulfurospirillum barnesii]AFL67474.1 ABC-type Mn2+/Zn2+ transport system, permease component [Sulfurospirillum barnesii SES-3]